MAHEFMRLSDRSLALKSLACLEQTWGSRDLGFEDILSRGTL